MKRTITVTFDREGNPTVEAHGFQGHGCKAATEAIEQALGTIETVTAKPELYQGGTVGTTQRQTT